MTDPRFVDGIRLFTALTLGVQGRMPRAKMATLKRIHCGENLHSRIAFRHDVYDSLTVFARALMRWPQG
jgi:hypothetical protein